MKVFITGISRGIGRELAVRFSDLSHEVHGVYRSESEGIEALQKDHNDVNTHKCNLDSHEEIERLLADLKSVDFDVLVNNAAEYISFDKDTFNKTDWDRMLQVNLTAPLQLMQGLSFSSGASILNIASTDAYVAGYDSPAYSASKAGLISLTKSMAGVLASRGIRVNAICPGWVDTDMAQEDLNDDAHYKSMLGRNAKTSEIVDLIEYLCSKKASYITGSIIDIDGGYSKTDVVLKKEAGL